MKRAIAIRHVAFEDLGTLADALVGRGYSVKYVEAASECLSDLDPLTPELVVVLGGPMGVYQESDYPFLSDELEWLARRLSADQPTLEICLGAQLMARALGARVYPGYTKEIGWSPVELSEAGRKSPLRHLASEQTAVLHWHGDTFDLPEGAIHLASNASYPNQAFAWGERGLALQFHPEVTAKGLQQWFVGHAHEIEATPGISVAQLREETKRYSPVLESQAAKLWREWLNVLDSEQALQTYSVTSYPNPQ